MKKLILAAALLATTMVAMATPNSPANRCKRYAHAHAFELTITQLCGVPTDDTYKNVLHDQSCKEALGSEEAVQEQQDLHSQDLNNEYQRIGQAQFCAKYAK